MNSWFLVTIVASAVAALLIFRSGWEPDMPWFDPFSALRNAALALLVPLVAVSGLTWWQHRDAGTGAESTVKTERQVAAVDDDSEVAGQIAYIMDPTPTESPKVAATSGLTRVYLDMGDCADDPSALAGECEGEMGAEYAGWGMAQGSWNGMPFTTPGRGDSTLRDMQIGGDNVVFFSGLASVDFILSAEVGDGGCDDSFQIVVNGEVLYEYHHTDPTYETFGAADGGPHQVRISASYVEGGELEVNFHNISTDGCGSAGVFNIHLDRASRQG